VERILLIDVLAIAGTAGHRWLLAGITSFGRRMALRMRYAKVGGTHLPGDTSDLGAALALNSPALGMGGGLRTVTGSGRYSGLGTRHRLMNALTAMADGTGMPVDTGRMLADATAEAGRGLAPLTAAAVGAGMAARLGAKGAHGLLIGTRPDEDRLNRWRKPTADGDTPAGGPPGGEPAGPGSSSGPGGRGGSGPGRPGGPSDRYRTPEGRIIDPLSGRLLHDQSTDRTLLSTRAHNRLVRYRGYRILHRTGRAAYGTTLGLPADVRRAGSGGSRYAQDARQQVRVWGNTLREDGRAWADAGRHASHLVREESGDRGGMGPFLSGRLPTRTAPAAPARTTARPGTPPSPPSSAGNPAAPTAAPGPGSGSAAGAALRREAGPVLPGGRGAGDATRDQARARFQDLLRRTAHDAERRRQEQARRRGEGGEGA